MALNNPIGAIQGSGSLSKQTNWLGLANYQEYYNEALQQTSVEVCQKIDDYNPQYPVMAWVNKIFTWRFNDEKGWDILFFSGHSQTESAPGRIFINRSDSLTMQDLREGLKTAVRRGLQLAFFNSCDGLGIAAELESLHIPQIIVMREPVPDKVAHDGELVAINLLVSDQSCSFRCLHQWR